MTTRKYTPTSFRDEADEMQVIEHLSVQESIIEYLKTIPSGSYPKHKLDPVKHENLIFGYISNLNHVFWRTAKGKRDRDQFVRLCDDELEERIGWLHTRVRDLLRETGILEFGAEPVRSTSKRIGRCREYRLNLDLTGGACRRIPVFGPNQFPDRLQRIRTRPQTTDFGSDGHNLARDNTFRVRINTPINAYLLLHSFDQPQLSEMIQRQKSIIQALSYSYGPYNTTDYNRSSFTVDERGRIYSDFTCLLKEARSHLSLCGEKLVGIDIHASHWFHAVMLWPNTESKERDLLREKLTTCDFYEFLAEILGEDSRDAVKIPSLKILHSHPKRMSKQTATHIEKLRGCFPDFCAWLESQKNGPKEWDTHKEFSDRLMKEESDRVIVDTIGTLAGLDPEYPVLPLHDAIFTAESRAEEALRVFRNVYLKRYGSVPRIQIEAPHKIDVCDLDID